MRSPSLTCHQHMLHATGRRHIVGEWMRVTRAFLIVLLVCCRDMEDSTSLEDNESQERGSLTSFGSGHTTDSDKVGHFYLRVLDWWLFTKNPPLFACVNHMFNFPSHARARKTFHKRCRQDFEFTWLPLTFEIEESVGRTPTINSPHVSKKGKLSNSQEQIPAGISRNEE